MYLFLLSDLLFWFGDNLLLLSEDHLNVARGAHVGVNAPVGTVGTPAHLRGLVHLNMLNHQRVHIQTLGKESQESALHINPKCIYLEWFSSEQQNTTCHSLSTLSSILEVSVL